MLANINYRHKLRWHSKIGNLLSKVTNLHGHKKKSPTIMMMAMITKIELLTKLLSLFSFSRLEHFNFVTTGKLIWAQSVNLISASSEVNNNENVIWKTCHIPIELNVTQYKLQSIWINHLLSGSLPTDWNCIATNNMPLVPFITW